MSNLDVEQCSLLEGRGAVHWTSGGDRPFGSTRAHFSMPAVIGAEADPGSGSREVDMYVWVSHLGALA
jgi:hypothetical protein